DIVVNCFRQNLQSIEGAAAVGESIARHREAAPIRMLPAPMGVDTTDEGRVQPLRGLARYRFEGHPQGLDEAQTDAYWADVEVPYCSRYAYEETLAVFGEPGGDEHAVLRAYERLSSAISGGMVDRLAPIAEVDR